MHSSKYRIRRPWKRFPQLRLRKMVDPQGDTGCFLISTFDTPEVAKPSQSSIRAEGIVTSSQGVNNVVMTNWGLHIYSNIPSLVNKTGVDKKGSPWGLLEIKALLPVIIKALVRWPIAYSSAASCSRFLRALQIGNEQDIVRAFRKVLGKQA